MHEFQRQQRAVTAWLRHPADAMLPVGMDPSRLQVYRSLFFNNMAAFVESAFPRLQALLPEASWERLLMTFFAEHRCRSPYFYDIPGEFLAWLQGAPETWEDMPWLLELAHFEWAMLAADIADEPMPPAEPGDIMAGVPVLNPHAWLLAYRWPVQSLDSGGTPARDTFLLVFRSTEHRVSTWELSPRSAEILERLRDNPTGVTGRILLEACDLSPTDFRTAEAFLQELYAAGVLLGVRPDYG